MQAKTILEKTGCPQPTFKDWLSKGVILPAQPGQGKGTHAVYDESNAVAIFLGMRMKEAGIVVTNYVAAFKSLHVWLRETSSFEWHRHVVALTPQGISVLQAMNVIDLDDMALVVPLAPICEALAKTVEGERQFAIFRVHGVKKAG